MIVLTQNFLIAAIATVYKVELEVESIHAEMHKVGLLLLQCVMN